MLQRVKEHDVRERVDVGWFGMQGVSQSRQFIPSTNKEDRACPFVCGRDQRQCNVHAGTFT